MTLDLMSLMVASLAFGAQDAGADSERAAAEPIKATYACTGGQTLEVAFTDGKATVTPKGGEPISLTQAVTADGFEYRDATHSLRGRGNEAIWSTGNGEPLNCTAEDEERG